MLINRRAIAREKLEQLKNGQSAYAETSEVSTYIEKQINELELNVAVDKTPRGNWFYPLPNNEEETFESIVD